MSAEPKVGLFCAVELTPAVASPRQERSFYVVRFVLFDSRRYQRERRSVRQCNERPLIGDPPVGAAEDQHLKEASQRPFELPSLLRDSSP